MIELTVYRISGWDTPFWVGPNRWGRRYNKAMSGPVQYWSLHPLTPWAEILRGHGIRSVEDAAELRQRVWAARIQVDHVADLYYDTAGTFGLEAHHLVSDDYGACQDFGDRCLNESGLPSVIRVPSAALPGTKNLVVFGPRILVPYLVRPIGLEDVPASVSAEQAQPPQELIPMVRHFEDEHVELKAWEKGPGVCISRTSPAAS